MKRTVFLLAAFCVLLFASDAAAQPPKVMLFEREDIKPGKFEDHVRESHDFARTLVKASDAGQPAYHRIGMSPIAGNTNEVMYVWFFDSLDTWAKSGTDIERWLTTPGPVKAYFDELNATRRGREDYHSLQRSMVGVLRPDLSYNPRQDIGKTRYLSVTTLRVKPGHIGDFMKIGAMYIGATRKMRGDDHWAMYEIVGGGREGLYVVVSAMESLAEMDKMLARGPDFVRAMGDEMDDFEDLVAKAMDPSDTMIYAFNPLMSNPPKAVMDSDRAFWGRQLPPADAGGGPANARMQRASSKRRAARQ